MLIKIERRKDARPVKKKEKPPLPKWAVLDEDAKELPRKILVPPTAEEAEECWFYGKELPYREVKIKGLQITDIPTAYLNV